MTHRIAVWILADQLTVEHPGLAEAEAEVGRDKVRVFLVESREALRRLPYHKKRQVLHLSAGRHFEKELEGRGYVVDRVQADDSRAGLALLISKHKPSQIVSMAAADYSPRRRQDGSMSRDFGIPSRVLPNTMFLVGRFNPIPDPEPDHRYVMENFYRAMRRRFHLLMEADNTPAGGKWNLDSQNRKPLPKTVKIPPCPTFSADAITRKVMEEVDASGHGVGETKGFDLAVSRDDAAVAFDDFLRNRLECFGPFEDAMRAGEGVLFHSVLSPQMNLGLLEPLAMAQSAEAEYQAGRVPLNSVEGFIRQIIGWREFMYWQYHRQMPGLRSANGWSATAPLPKMLWDGQTEMNCIAKVVNRLIETGYTHHIERLMIICNLCLLAGVNPAAVADWFLTFYNDSHDWVVLPNVIGMGLNADGGLTATKPYISSAAYIKKMGDFCRGCRYRPDVRTGPTACPFNFLYWNFLIDHETTLRSNPRLGPAVLGLSRMSESDRERIKADATDFLKALEPYGE